MALKIRSLRKTDSARSFLDFISELIEADGYLLVDEKPTLTWERNWLNEKRQAIRNGQEICLGAWEGKRLVASCAARRGKWKERNNVGLGIAVLKAYRGKGLGKRLLQRVIREVRREMRPKNIWLSHLEGNRPARKLYEKGRLP